LCSRIDVYLWVIDQCHAKPWGPCISTESYCPKVYLWLSEAYWRELPCAYGSECLCLVVPKISANQCPALINWYLNEYWLLWHILGIVGKVFIRAFRCILDRVNRASIYGVMAEWSLWQIVINYFISVNLRLAVYFFLEVMGPLSIYTRDFFSETLCFSKLNSSNYHIWSSNIKTVLQAHLFLLWIITQRLFLFSFLFYFYFLFLEWTYIIRKVTWYVTLMSHDHHGKVVHRPSRIGISSVLKSSRDSNEFFLSTLT